LGVTRFETPPLETQSAYHFNPRCAACRKDDSDKRNAGERQGGEQIRQWIAGRDAEDDRRDNPAPGAGCGNAESQASEHEPCALPE